MEILPPKYINRNFKITLIRHAQTIANTKPELIGGRSPQTPLSNDGKSQAVILGDRLSSAIPNVHLVYSSPLIRALDTAKISLARYNQNYFNQIHISNFLTEFSQGDWEGLDRGKVYNQINKNIINQQKTWFCPPNGESVRMLKNRASRFLEEEVLLKFYNLEIPNNAHILVFGHGIWIKSILMEILGLDQIVALNLVIDNCSMTQLEFNDSGWKLNYLNRV